MRGSAMVAAMIFIVIGTVIVAGFILYISRESWLIKRNNDSIKALYIAEAGLERKLYELSTGNYADIPVTYFPEVDDPQSYYTVSVTQDGDVYIVTSTGHYYLGKRVIRRNATIFNLWDLAVFSGGATSGQIAGNTHIRGSVYVLGEEPFIDANENSLFDPGVDTLIDENANGIRDHLNPDDYAINGTGTFYIGNDYNAFDGSNAIPDGFLSRIIPASTLDAGVNVKYGKTVLSGSTQIGNEAVPMDLVNAVDGFIPEDPTGKVFVEEGGLIYDRGMISDKIRLPSLYDVVDGTTRMNALQNNGLVLTSGTDIPEDITPISNFTVSDGVNSLSMDGEGHMTISGIIYINGNLSLDRYKGDRTMWYTGKGSVVLTGNLTINVDLYTLETGSSAYPTNNIIGFMTPQNINLGVGAGAAQLEMMALFYAGGHINTEKQTAVAGAFITNHVDMSTNVPEIFQVKGVKDNLPPGMIDIPPVVIVYNWEEVFE